MDEFIHEQNLILFKKHLAEAKDGIRRNMLLKLLAAEEIREVRPTAR